MHKHNYIKNNFDIVLYQVTCEDIDHYQDYLSVNVPPPMFGLSKARHAFVHEDEILYRPFSCHCNNFNSCVDCYPPIMRIRRCVATIGSQIIAGPSGATANKRRRIEQSAVFRTPLSSFSSSSDDIIEAAVDDYVLITLLPEGKKRLPNFL
jgi:hypothetical protein